MMTYLIETTDNDRDILLYDDYQSCKDYLKTCTPLSVCMLALEGQHYGEGFHKYRMLWDGTKFKREAA